MSSEKIQTSDAARDYYVGGSVRGAVGWQGSVGIRRCVQAIIAITAVAGAVSAGAEPVVRTLHFDIAPESLSQALRQYGQTSGQEIIFTEDLVAGKQVRGLKGDYTSQAALEKLLEDTGLIVERSPSGTLMIRRLARPISSSHTAASGEQAAIADKTQGPALQDALVPLEEIVVTANKRAERLQDIGASVTAVTADILTRSGAVRFEDYVGRIPGLSVVNTSSGGGLNQLSIRGISTGSGGSPTVGFYIDDSPFGSSTTLGGGAILAPDLDPSDLTRVEVLRGPQGTLYGAGSLGGLVKFVTTAPDYTRLTGRVEVDGSKVTGGGGAGYGVRGAANIPLRNDFAIRVSAFDRQDPAFMENVRNGERNINTTQSYGGRISAGWRISDVWSLRLSALDQHLHITGAPTIQEDAATSQPLAGDLQQYAAAGTGATSASYDLYDLRLEGTLGWADFVSISSLGKLNAAINTDWSLSYAPLVEGVLGLSGVGVASQANVDLTKATQEFRLTSPEDQRLAWQAGAFYTHERVHLKQTLPVFQAATGLPFDPAVPPLLIGVIPSSFAEVAGFADVTYKFSPHFDTTIGIRVSHNKQAASEMASGLLVGPTTTVALHSRDTSATYLFSPRWHITRNLMAYARAATGYRPGGPNVVTSGVSPSYEPDTVVNYELGLKAVTADGRLSFDVAAFDILWRNIQVREQTPSGVNFYGNGGKASSRGLEATTDWRPFAGLQIGANFSYVQAKLSDDLSPPLLGVKGDRLPDSPRWSGQFDGEYETPLAARWTGFIGASWQFVGNRYSDFSIDPAVARARLPSYDIVSLRFGARRDDWVTTLYAKNIGDKRGLSGATDVAAIRNIAVIQPRTVGISVAVAF